MNFQEFPEIRGEGLMVPRIEYEPTRIEPAFDGMGVLIGPGVEDGTLNAVITGRKRGVSYLLDGEYEKASDGFVYFRLEEGNLVARREYTGDPRETDPVQEVSDHITAWPPEEGHTYTLPFETKDGNRLETVAHVGFSALDVFFRNDEKRYQNDKVLRDHGIVVYGRSLLMEHRYGLQPPPERLNDYHSAGVLLGASGAGKVAVATVGKLGAIDYLLASRGRRMSRGHHDLTVANGRIYGNTAGSKPKHIAKIKSKKLPQIKL